jgi:hypothetical protein
MLGGLPGGSGPPGRAEWIHMILIAACAILVVAALVKALFYVVDVIELT